MWSNGRHIVLVLIVFLSVIANLIATLKNLSVDNANVALKTYKSTASFDRQFSPPIARWCYLRVQFFGRAITNHVLPAGLQDLTEHRCTPLHALHTNE
jgi:hypothetical protein